MVLAKKSFSPTSIESGIIWKGLPFILLSILVAALLPLSISIAYAILVILIGIYLAFRFPYYGLLYLLSFYPLVFFYKRLQYFQSSVLQEFNNPISLLPQILTLVLILRIGLGLISQRKVRKFSPISLAVLVLILTYFLQITNNESLVAGIFGFRTVGIPMLLFFVSRHLIDSKKRLAVVIQVLFWILFAVSVYGLRQAIFGVFQFEYNWALDFAGLSNLGWFLWARGRSYLRIFSIVSTPFELAALMMIGPFIIFPFFKQAKSRMSQLIAGLLVLTVGGTLLATGIRGAWFGTLAGAATFVTLIGNRSIRQLVLSSSFKILGFAITVGFTFLMLSISLQNVDTVISRRLNSLANPLQVSHLQTRFGRWSESFETVQENPLGLGTGSSGFNSRRFDLSVQITPDSLYIQALLELGWIGPVIFFVLFIVAIFYFVQQQFALNDSVLSAVNLAILAIVVTVMVHGLTTPLQESHMMISWFWILLGMGTNLNVMDKTMVSNA